MDVDEVIEYGPHELKQVEGFLNETRTWLGPRLRKVTSYLALKTDAGYVLLLARVRCESVFTTPEVLPRVFSSERLLAGVHIEVFDKVDPEEILRNEVHHARIVLPDGALEIPRDRGRLSPYKLDYPDAITDNATPRICGLRLRGQQFSGIEPYVFNNAGINWELKGAKTPYYDINDLLAELGMDGMRTQSDGAYLEILVVPPALIGRQSSISQDTVHLIVATQPEFSTTDLEVGFLAHGKYVERFSIAKNEIKWETMEQNCIGTVSHKIEGVVFTQIFLRYRGQAIDQMMLINPDRSFNPAAELYRLIDADRGNLVRYLSGEGENRAPQLEAGIAILLHLHGFQVLHLGKKLHWANDASDLMAITSGGNVLIVECTTGLINNGSKLAKLHARTEQARAILTAANMAYINVLPVMVTTRTAEEIAGDTQEAARLGIAVFCRPNIDQAVAEISTSPNADAFYKRLSTLVPDKQGQHGYAPLGGSDFG